MKKLFKCRALAIVLSICMLFGLLPVDMLGGVLEVKAEETTWVDGTTVSEAVKGQKYYFDYTQDTLTAEGTYGLLTVAHNGSATGFNSATHGVEMKVGNTYTFKVAGNSYITFSGNNNSQGNLTASSTTGAFETETLSTKASGVADMAACQSQGDNSISFLYVGSAGEVTLTLGDAKAYINSICIIPASDDLEIQPEWVDGTTVSENVKGQKYYFDYTQDTLTAEGTYGLLTVAHNGSATGFNSATHGVEMKVGNTYTFKVAGNSYITFSGNNNSQGNLTASSTTGAFETETLSTKASGVADMAACQSQGDNSISFLYVGSAGEVTLTLGDAKAYINSICIIPAADDITIEGDDEGGDETAELVVTPLGSSETARFENEIFGETGTINGEATLLSANNYIQLTIPSGASAYSRSDHGMNFANGIYFTMKVPANAMGVLTLNECAYAGGGATVTVKEGGAEGTVVVDGASIIGSGDATDAIIHKYCNSTAEEQELYVLLSSGWVHGITWAVTDIPQNATVTGTVDAALNGQLLFIKEGENVVETVTIADGAYSVELPVGTSYTVAFEQGIYQINEGATLDLSSAEANSNVTNNITYTELTNQLVLDAEATTWNLKDSTFGAYAAESTIWKSGDGLEISGDLQFQSSSHGAWTAQGQVYTIYVPAGETTFSLQGCQYDDKTTAEITYGTTTEEIDLRGKTLGNIDVAVEKTFISDVATTVTIELLTGGGYLHGITAQTETVKQTATVSGTVSPTLDAENLVFKATSDGDKVIAAVSSGTYTVELPVGDTYSVYFEKGIYEISAGDAVDLSSAAAGASVTNNITYTELSNRIVLDANAIIWNLVDANFGAYGCDADTWYLGDGPVITGDIALTTDDPRHGAALRTGQVFSFNVPAGQTTIALGACCYGSATATINGETVTIKHSDTANDGNDMTFIFTNDADATIDIAITGNGYLHSISAKTETVQPSATVSGTVDAAVNGQVLNFMVGGATLATATIADGAYTVDLPVGNKYTIAFANADVYEVTSGATVDLTSVTAGSTVTNNVTYAAWDVNKSFSVEIGDTTFNVTPGSSKADAFTAVVTNGSGEVELSTPAMALVWANLQGLGSGVLTADKITAVSDNITTSFNGNVLTVSYNDKTTNPASYQITVKDNSGTGTPLADGTPINYSFTDGSIVSTLYDGKAYSLSGGQTLSATDKLLTVTANKKIFYNGVQHGIAIGQNDSISIRVAGDAEITFGTCLYTNGQKASELTVSGLAEGATITPSTANFTSVEKDGELISFKYTGDATTLVFTYASAGSGYVHSVSVKNNAIASDVANAQTMMPKVLSYGTAANLEALPVGQRMILTQTGGQMTTVDEAVNPSVSYFGFEPVTGKYKLEADVVLSTGASSN